MAVVTPAKLDEFLAIAAKWGVEAAVIGEVNASGRLTIDHHGQRIVDVDPRTVAHDSPVYDRPYARPQWQDALNADTVDAAGLARPETGDELRATALSLLGSANLASKEWATSQFDRFVKGNTALSAPDDSGIIRIDQETGLGIALASDASGRYTKLDPRTGAQLALAESYRNVATTGARPLAISDCLNFGSPEDPDCMWQLVEAIEGLADGCQTLAVPVTGGNVSLYNSTGEAGHIDSSIHPTPVVVMLGVLDDVTRATTSGWRNPGETIFLLGTTRAELDGSAWADVVHDHLGGMPPRVDFAAEKALAEVLVNATRDELIDAAHDLSEGGLIQGLLESALRYGVGAQINLDALLERDGVSTFEALFSESTARAIVAVPRGEEVRFVDACVARGVPHVKIGETGAHVGDDPAEALVIDGQFTIPLAEAKDIFEATLPNTFG